MERLNKVILSILLAVFISACGSGGGGTNAPVNDVGKVEGTVTDSSTSAALSGVTVQIGDKTATTGSNGVYSIQDIDVGTKTVTASKTGYQNHNGTCEVSKGTTVSHNVQLTANPTSDTTPPTVSSTSPANNAVNIAVNSSVTVTFSEAMDVSTITTATFTLKQGTNAIAGTVTYTGTTATFTPSSNLSYSTSYTATITTGAKDTAGNAMTSNYSWSFTIGVAPDTTPPTVTSTSPANNATDVAVNSTITATFSEAMTASTITTATFSLKQGTTTIAGTVTYNGTSATFTPSSNLSYSTTYTAIITTGVKDAAGNAMASSYSWSFMTGIAPDTTPPTVTSTSPANNATDVAVNSTITAIFSEAMDVSTITTATFTLKQGTTPVSGTVTYSGTTATFTSSSNLAFSTIYTAIISTGAKDSAGNALAAAYTWTFSTGAATASSGAVSLPETGQTTCFDSSENVISCANTGQDGDVKAGVSWPAQRFTVGSGAEADCITDNLTGLMWVKSPDSTERTWQQSLDYANNLTLCGYSDWRLPNRKELVRLINYGYYDPVLFSQADWLNLQGFSNMQSWYYWSSTTVSFSPTRAFFIDMTTGALLGYAKTANKFFYALPVRAGQGEYTATVDLPETGQTTCFDSSGNVISCANTGQDGDVKAGVSWPAQRFTVGSGAEADCITDNLTGLTWVKNPDNSTNRTWQQALDFANGLALCGYSDWRLPNINELESLVNAEESNSDAWLNTQGFSNLPSGDYWSSTTNTGRTLWGYARRVFMWISGSVTSNPKNQSDGFVLPVRGGQ